LPPPALAVSERLTDRIRAAIDERGGTIAFDQYMRMTLYEPGLGYYSAGAVKFGRDGDFVTAPEVSPLFGRCLARQVRQVLATIDGGDILEFGAGSGRLAADVLAELEGLDTLPGNYLILEVSADLRERQQHLLAERIPRLLARVRWLDTLPDRFRGVVIANEVLDAMPVKRFRWLGDGALELGVGIGEAGFVWKAMPAGTDIPLAAAVARIRADIGLVPGAGIDWPPGYTSEVNLAIGPWIAALAAVLESGAALLIDYGYPRREYYHPQRTEGTLLCHYRHRVHGDPFWQPGLQDITAAVDFTAVAEAAQAAGLAIAGFTTQARFLLALGLTDRLAEQSGRNAPARLELARQARMLTLPAEMGEHFKVLALTRAWNEPLAGFTGVDQTARL
jgi:SAM-dependent MidA family methyltransferase